MNEFNAVWNHLPVIEKSVAKNINININIASSSECECEFIVMAQMFVLLFYSKVSNTTSAICTRIVIFFLLKPDVCIFSFFISFTSRIDIFFPFVFLPSFVYASYSPFVSGDEQTQELNRTYMCVYVCTERQADKQLVRLHTQHSRIAFGLILDIRLAVTHMYSRKLWKEERGRCRKRGTIKMYDAMWLRLLSRDSRSGIRKIQKHLYMLANIDCCWTNFSYFYSSIDLHFSEPMLLSVCGRCCSRLFVCAHSTWKIHIHRIQRVVKQHGLLHKKQFIAICIEKKSFESYSLSSASGIQMRRKHTKWTVLIFSLPKRKNNQKNKNGMDLLDLDLYVLCIISQSPIVIRQIHYPIVTNSYHQHHNCLNCKLSREKKSSSPYHFSECNRGTFVKLKFQ